MTEPPAVERELFGPLAARPRAAALAGAACLAFSGIFFRFSGTSPSTATVFRCGYALPFLWAWTRWEDRRLGKRPWRARGLAFLAGLFFAADLVTWQHSVQQVGAGLATVLANMQVVVVALVAWAMLGERPTARVLAGIPLVVAGAALISGVLERGAYGANPALGVLFGVAAAVAYSGYLMLIRRANTDRRLAGPLLDASAASAVGALIAGAVVGDLDLVPTWPAHGWLLVVALTSQVAGYGLVNVSLPRLPAALTSILLMAQPVMTVALGALLLAERPSLLQLGGVALILVGIFVSSAPLGRLGAIRRFLQPSG